MLSQFYAPVVGGQERVVESMSVALTRRGHDVALATLWHDGSPEHEVRDGVHIHRIRGLAQRAAPVFSDPARRHVPPAPDPGVVRGLRRLVSDLRPDVVHAHDWLVHSALPFGRRGDVPVVMSLHDHSLTCATKRLMRNGERCTGPGLAKCVACSARHYGVARGAPIALALGLLGHRVAASVDRFLPVSESVAVAAGLAGGGLPFEVLPNFLTHEVLHAGDASTGATETDADDTARLPADGFVLFVGDATHDKGIDVLLRAHHLLDGRAPLVVLGRPLSPALVEPRPDVTVLGPQPHAAVLRAMRHAGVVVVPSLLSEAFGMVALEAMAMGTPVVATRSGGLADIVVDGESGHLVEPGDVDALAAALRRVLDDPGHRVAMSRSARQRARDFSEDLVVGRLERIYCETTGRAHA
jgi:glycosyltransferase involved in cell wall biosynthesis